MKKEASKYHVGRRNFLKISAMAGVAATISETALPGQDARPSSQSKTNRTQKKVLCLSGNPITHGRLVESIKSIPGTDLQVTLTGVNFQRPAEVLQAIKGQDADFLLLCLSGFTFSFGSLYDSMGDLNIPVIIMAGNPSLTMIDANFAASLRGNGAMVTFALSEKQVMDSLKMLAAPKILEGRQALIFSRPFDSTTVPAHNLTEDLIYQRTGVKVRFRSMEELVELYRGIDETSARSEMERWKKEAVEVIRVPDKSILDTCKLYVLLRSLIEKESLSAVSIDCVSFTMNRNAPLPIPCLAFSRLRDEGITAACEADVCSLLSSMFLEQLSLKPSFMANVMSVDLQNSNYVFSHCVAPLKLDGRQAAPMRYRLHDYHNLGKGVVPEVEFPIGKEVIAGGFSKDLKSFTLWPGRIQSQVKDTESPIGNVCANTIKIKIKDADPFLQNIVGLHHVMVVGNYIKAIEDALARMNVTLAVPPDLTAPEA